MITRRPEGYDPYNHNGYNARYLRAVQRIFEAPYEPPRPAVVDRFSAWRLDIAEQREGRRSCTFLPYGSH